MSFSMNATTFLMLSVFAIAAVGYVLGRITIKGISLGTAGVFVIALRLKQRAFEILLVALVFKRICA